MSTFVSACDSDDSGTLYFAVECHEDQSTAIYVSMVAQKSLFTAQSKVSLDCLHEF
jgi:hypothetical protein